jgi:putative flippase GtrA
MLGGSIPLAYGFQFISTAICAALVAVLWYGRADRRLCAAALTTGALLSTPYALDYDMMLLGPALAFVVAYGVEKGFLPWEKSLLALVWIVPIIARNIAEVTFVPVGVLTMIAFMSFIARRAVHDEQFDWRSRWAERSPLMQQIGVFSLVGATGFFIDTGLTLLFADVFSVSGYVARVPAIIIAVIATWFLNRTWTFRSKDPRVLSEFARYGLASVVTSVFNYAIFCGVLAALAYQGIARDTDRLSIAIGMIAGSGAAAVLNFVLSKFFAFARPAPPKFARP